MRTDRWWVRTAWLLLVAVMFIGMAPALAQDRTELPEGVPQLERSWSEDPDKFHFAILGDRTGGSPQEWPVYDRALEEINLLRPDFVIMVGDLIEGYVEDMDVVTREWEEFFEHTGQLEVPFLYLPGNHDIFSKASYDHWREHHGLTYFSFRHKGCQFIALNTEEVWATEPRGSDALGSEQIAWLLDEIENSTDARHTFIFMHKPIWRGDDSEGWQKAEVALADRPYTVFAGHHHRLQYEERNDARYFVVSATKGVQVRTPNVSPELGNFPQFTQVVVDGDDTHIAHIEPGGIWPKDIAHIDTLQAVRGVLRTATPTPERLGTDNGRAYLDSILENRLEDPLTITVFFPDIADTGWRIIEDSVPQGATDAGTAAAPAYTLTVPAGGQTTINWAFETPEDRVTPTPRVGHRGTHPDWGQILAATMNLPLYPNEALRWPDTWMVTGAWRLPALPRSMPQNPREAAPYLFEPYGPEAGYQGGRTFEADGEPVGWHEQPGVYLDGPGFVYVGEQFGTPYDMLAYATAAVYSPEAQRVYARFRVDDYGIIFLNGEMLGPGLIRTRRDPLWVAFDLEAGWNTVTVQNAAITGGWNFWLGFADPEETLQFAPYPPE